jgi:hypothetical protein
MNVSPFVLAGFFGEKMRIVESPLVRVEFLINSDDKEEWKRYGDFCRWCGDNMLFSHSGSGSSWVEKRLIDVRHYDLSTLEKVRLAIPYLKGILDELPNLAP